MMHHICFEYGLAIPSERYRVPAKTLRGLLHTLEEYGYTRAQIRLMAKKMPALLGFSSAKIQKSLMSFESLGFSAKEILVLTVKCTSLLGFTHERMSSWIESVRSQGYSRDEVMGLIKTTPQVGSVSIQKVESVFALLNSYNITSLDTRIMVKKLPAILCYSTQRTQANLLMLQEIECDISQCASLLMIAPAVLRGRIAILKSLHIEVRRNLLVMASKRWEKRFAMSREDVIAFGQIGQKDHEDIKPRSS